jgi:hypothetical protein
MTFKPISLSFELTWEGVHIILSAFCSLEEKHCVRLSLRPLLIVWQLGSLTTVYTQWPTWNCQRGQPDLGHRDYMITCLLEGMKKCIVMPENYDKIKVKRKTQHYFKDD